MSQHRTSRATRYLPQVVVATTVVAVLPVAIVWILLAEGVISSPWVCFGLAIALSLAASVAGSAYWKRRGGHGDMLFSELLLWGWLHRYRAERRLANAVDLLGLADITQGLTSSEESTERTAEILREMAAALDAQDPYTDGHSRRVALHATMIARKLGLPREETAKLRTAAAVHDIGKLRTPPEVLNKAGKLTAAEFDVVKRHVEDGAEIVSVMEDPELTATVRHHHERFDGDGYPDGLVGRQTPAAARIIAVADTFDALTSVRPYRAAVSHKKALAIIVDASGSQLDPVAVRAFLKCYSGRRWILFWALLAASPRRAFGVATGRPAGRTNLSSAATITAPATVAAVVAAVVGGAGSVEPAHAPQLAQSPQLRSGSNGSSAGRSGGHPGATGRASGSANFASPLAKEVALRISRPHNRSVGLAARASSSGASSDPDPAHSRLPDQRSRPGMPSRPGRKPPPRSVVELPPVVVAPRPPAPAPPPTPNPVASRPASPPRASGGPRGDTKGQNDNAQGQNNNLQGQNNGG